THIPNVKDLHPAVNKDGLLLEGYAACWSLDRVGDSFNPDSLTRTVKSFMATNPVLLFNHKVSLPPIGKVLKAEIHKDKGLWIRAIMPRPAPGNFANEVYESTKNGLLRAFSVSGIWKRRDRGAYQEIVDADITEISLAPIGINRDTFASAITPTAAKA